MFIDLEIATAVPSRAVMPGERQVRLSNACSARLVSKQTKWQLGRTDILDDLVGLVLLLTLIATSCSVRHVSV